jgi:streptomycin 6-kinase
MTNTNDLLDHAAFLGWAQQRAVAAWGLRLGARLSGGYSGARLYTCVDHAGAALVLKLSSPDDVGGGRARAVKAGLEAAALRVWHGHGAAAVRAFDAVSGALLLERIVPGTHLSHGNPEEGARVAAEVLAALHGAGVDAAWEFAHLADWFDTLIGFGTPVHEREEPDALGWGYLDVARAAGVDLCAERGSRVLLHGDFLNKNLLLGPTGYVAVDPLPMLGDPCCDVGFFAASYQPATHVVPVARLAAARLGYDPTRAERWAAVWAVNEARETWRPDYEALASWVASRECAELLST